MLHNDAGAATPGEGNGSAEINNQAAASIESSVTAGNGDGCPPTAPDILAAALTLHAAGCSVVAVRADGSKQPRGSWKTYQTDRASEQQVRGWFANGHPGVGIVCGAVSGNLEMLELEGRAIQEGLYEQLVEVLNASGLADLWQRVTTGWLERSPSGGLHVHYRVTGAPAPRNTKLASRLAREDELTGDERQLLQRHPNKKITRPLIETRGEGGFVVTAPSHGPVHPTGRPYELLAGGPATIPDITADEHEALHDVCRMLNKIPADEQPNKFTQPGPGTPSEDGIRPGDEYEQKVGWAEILKPHGWTQVYTSGRISYWRRPGKEQGVSATTGYAEDRDRLYVFSTSTEFEAQNPYTKFGAYALLDHAGDHSAAARELRRQGYGSPALGPVTNPASGTGAGLPIEHRGEMRFAERLAQRYTGRLLHVHGLGWYVWDGRRWKPDRDGAAQRAVIDTVKAAFSELSGLADDGRRKLLRDIGRCESASGVTGVLRLASCLTAFAVSPDRLDADPYLLNTADGTLDLRTGEVREHTPTDLITKVTRCGLQHTGTDFAEFLHEVLPDPAVRAFVQRLLGYALLGAVREHVLALFVGSGCNGKSTLLETVMAAMGDYSIAADPELLLHRDGAHPTGQADLLGVRLAVMAETGEGRKLAPATVKRLTGGDKIRARRMRQDFFEFEPSHTLVVMTNHRPVVPGDDPAMWRRLLLVPFDVVVQKPDPTLLRRLAQDLPAVLGWLVEGYKQYADVGLAAPDAVMARTDEYRASSDALGRFLEERTHANPNDAVGARELYTAWCEWCRHNGEEIGSEMSFAEAMSRRGIGKKRRAAGVVYPGVMLCG